MKDSPAAVHSAGTMAGQPIGQPIVNNLLITSIHGVEISRENFANSL
jgi:hypothetical protein